MNRKIFWIAALLICALAAAKGTVDIGRVMLLEARGAIDSDASIYFIMGRGILNGFTPYTELFESKPPGMFLLSALSLALTGSELLALSLQIFITGAIPMLLFFFAWNEAKSRGHYERIALALAAFAAGTAMSLYLQERAGGIQSESFGSFFGLIYLLLALRTTPTFSWKWSLLLSALLLFAIGIKEPFLVSIMASAVIVLGFSRRFVHSFVIPLCIAAVVGCVVMAALGWLLPYLQIYLPSLKNHVNSSPFDPAVIRGLTVGRLFGNLTIYYTAPLLGVLLAVTWLFAPIFRSEHKVSLLDIGITLLQSLAAYAALMFGFFFVVTWNIERFGYVLNTPIIPFSGGIYALILLAALGLLAVQWKRGLLLPALEAIVAIYLSAAAVGISIYARNHYAFAVPAYLALLLVFFRYAPRDTARAALVMPVLAVIVCGSLVYVPSQKHLAEVTDRVRYASVTHEETTKSADAILDACGVERYGSVGTFSTLAFAKHSPLGPLIHPPFFKFLGEGHPLFAETDRRLKDAKIIFAEYQPDDPVMAAYVNENFTETPPECAKPHLPAGKLKVYFRKNM